MEHYFCIPLHDMHHTLSLQNFIYGKHGLFQVDPCVGVRRKQCQIARGTTITLPSIALSTLVWQANRELQMKYRNCNDLSSASTHFFRTSFSLSVGRGILSVRYWESLIWQPPQWQFPPQKAMHLFYS